MFYYKTVHVVLYVCTHVFHIIVLVVRLLLLCVALCALKFCLFNQLCCVECIIVVAALQAFKRSCDFRHLSHASQNPRDARIESTAHQLQLC